MKVALLYWTWADDSEYGKAFDTKMDEWHLIIDKEALLKVGTEIHLVDPKTDLGIDLKVIKWHYELDYNLLRLQVVVIEDAEIGPHEFAEYILTNWIPGNKIYEKTPKENKRPNSVIDDDDMFVFE